MRAHLYGSDALRLETASSSTRRPPADTPSLPSFRRYWLTKFCDEVLTGLPGHPELDPFCGAPISRQALAWALAVVMSRCFGLQSAGCRCVYVCSMMYHFGLISCLYVVVRCTVVVRWVVRLYAI